ncbi:hypothetical protein SS50377_25950 [Spironucleus salmonicida]|uniref:Transmembrane protein n=1 Tax=Spironucleus salmonicida TaxID=348837 RepID=A0A9P8LPB0_9EUKA|nr:hypothetical protein SS50377_25950 [Spironucleus salmonicida]
MISLLAVTCYLPNATFIYNPITRVSILHSIYLLESTLNDFQICEKLDRRLVRASVELTNGQESFSKNFECQHKENVQVNIPLNPMRKRSWFSHCLLKLQNHIFRHGCRTKVNTSLLFYVVILVTARVLFTVHIRCALAHFQSLYYNLYSQFQKQQ